MNWRKMLARLNPRSPSPFLGSGGVPEFTAQDIAAALGMVRNHLGREVICLVWWPDGAKLTLDQLRLVTLEAMLGEWNERAHCVAVAKYELMRAQAKYEAKRVTRGPEYRELQQAQHKLYTAKRQAWPTAPGAYPRIVDAVLHEIATPNLCATCHGTGVVLDALDVPRTCPDCGGHGVVAVSDRARARAIERDHKTYAEAWAGVYEWTLRLLRDAEAEAGKQISRALRTEEAA